MTTPDLKQLLATALQNRQSLFETLHREETDTYRLFHGANEGCPGLTIDRYGTQILAQSFHQPFDTETVEGIRDFFSTGLDFESQFIFRDRSSASRKSGKAPVFGDEIADGVLQSCREFGVRYLVKGEHRGQDPLLFLDLRAGRRFVKEHCSGRSVLNLFSYTCGVGICAGVYGASEVWNVDFAKSSLAFGKQNAILNGLDKQSQQFVQSDYFPAIRQLAGLPVPGRGRKKEYRKLAARQFDLVFLDPPRWAKSVFGTVDLIRDYQSVLKPALLTVAEGGQLICTNHVPSVDLKEWLELLKRCAEKAGRPVKTLEVITPENDFPSPDGRHPLKIAVLNV